MKVLFSKISSKATNIHKTEKRGERNSLVKTLHHTLGVTRARKLKMLACGGYPESYHKDRKKLAGAKIAAKHLAIAADRERVLYAKSSEERYLIQKPILPNNLRANRLTLRFD